MSNNNSKQEIVFDIKESIEKHLPSQVGDVLKERLDRIEKLEGENGRLKDQNSQLQERVKDLKDDLSEHKTLDSRRDDIEERLKEVRKRERDMDVHDAKLRAEEAEKRADLSKEYVEVVFKSPVYRQSTSGYTASREHGGSFDKQTTEVVE